MLINFRLVAVSGNDSTQLVRSFARSLADSCHSSLQQFRLHSMSVTLREMSNSWRYLVSFLFFVFCSVGCHKFHLLFFRDSSFMFGALFLFFTRFNLLALPQVFQNDVQICVKIKLMFTTINDVK